MQKKKGGKSVTYFLMDLERTLLNGSPAYWKGNRHGYTYTLEFAGIFSEEIADEIVRHDLDGKTIKVPVDLVIKVLALDLKAHEG